MSWTWPQATVWVAGFAAAAAAAWALAWAVVRGTEAEEKGRTERARIEHGLEDDCE